MLMIAPLFKVTTDSSLQTVQTLRIHSCRSPTRVLSSAYRISPISSAVVIFRVQLMPKPMSCRTRYSERSASGGVAIRSLEWTGSTISTRSGELKVRVVVSIPGSSFWLQISFATR